VRPTDYAPPPSNGDNSHPRIPRMSVMRVILLHRYTKFEVRGPSFPFRRYGRFSVTALSSVVTLTFWPVDLEGMSAVAWKPPCHAIFHCPFLWANIH